MKKITFLLLAGACLWVLPLYGQYSVHKVNGGEAASDGSAGLYYCLPQNTLEVEITVERTFLERGVYSDYAEQLLKLPAIKANKTLYAIREIRIHTLRKADPAQTYKVEGPDFPSLRLSPEGILSGVNLPNEKMPPVNPMAVCGKDEPEKVNNPHPDARADFAPVAALNASRRFDTVVVRHKSDTATVIEKILTPRIDVKNLFEQARTLADQILKIRKNQSDLLSGLQEVPYPEGTLTFMYQQLERNEHRLLECFTGTMREERLHYKFEVVPQEGKTSYAVAFFSPEEGVEKMEGENENGTDVLYLNLTPLPSMTAEETDGAGAPEGFACRVPAKVKAEVVYNGNVLSQREVFVAQWGYVRTLPPLSGYRLKLHENTGALQVFEKIEPFSPNAASGAPASKKSKR